MGKPTRRAALTAAFFASAAMDSARAEPAASPTRVDIVIGDTATSHPFLAAEHQKQPFDLEKSGYVEEEYLISGEARVFEWPDSSGHKVLAHGPYTTRIVVRRPSVDARFSGTVIVEALNPSSPVDLPIMWAESYPQFIADGHAWVGVSVKPNTLKSLKRFDARRYAALAMPHPPSGPTCAADDINPWSQPTTPADETGLAWDILSQIGALLKGSTSDNPLSRPADRLYMTGQSQTAGYSRTYASVFGPSVTGSNGTPLYDAYLYSGSPPWQVPLHQCAAGFPSGDPRLITGAAGVPIIEVFAQGDLVTNVETRRPDSDVSPNLFRRYEVAGAAHVDPWEQLSFPSDTDMIRATGQANAVPEADCVPRDVEPSDFPVRYVLNAAWRNLDAWVRNGTPAPRADRLELRSGAGEPLKPDAAFVTDDHGNARGGVRSPSVDVPTARWIGATTPAFRCMFQGYKYSFDRAKLQRLYSNQAEYVEKVRESVTALAAERWLTTADAAAIVRDAERANIP
jgi:hypothetical protein